MDSHINLTGTWNGYFSFGQEYGKELQAEKVKFMLFLSQKNFKFEGTSVDYEGVGSDFQKASIKGFIKGNFISFIKQYPVFLQFDEKNNVTEIESKPSPEIHYTGHYDERTKTFSGNWEMVENIESDPFGDMEYLNTGTWEMKKEE